MAENRGGFRPTAPQNNPANVSAVGGAGQSGTQPARYISGLPYGQGQQTYDTQTAAPMAGNPTPTPTPNINSILPQIIPLNAPTQNPDIPSTSGVDVGPGVGSDAISLPGAVPEFRTDDSARFVQALYMQDPSNEDVRRALEFLQGQGRI